MDRRRALIQLTTLLGAALGEAACARREGDAEATVKAKPKDETGAALPIVFLAHGAPPLLDDAEWMSELAVWARQLPRPDALLVLSAHWEARPIALGATETVPLVHDFYGFPERHYHVQYPAPGAPSLAARVRGLLDASSLAHADEPARGLDHGAFVPLIGMYPAADVPALQVSLPGLAPQALAAFGRALAPLRDEGVLIMGSGFLTHNMSVLGQAETPSWAHEFDAWTTEVLARRDLDALIDFEQRAPAARLAHPRTEHFAPVIAAAAAAAERSGAVTFPITGWWQLSPAFTRRSVQFG